MFGKNAVIWAVAMCVGLLWFIAPTPAKAEIIEEWAHQNQGITHVEIANTVTEIKMGAYANNQLRRVVIPASVEMVREWAFEHNLLDIVVIEGDETKFDDTAFANNSSSLLVVGHPGSPAEAFAATNT